MPRKAKEEIQELQKNSIEETVKSKRSTKTASTIKSSKKPVKEKAVATKTAKKAIANVDDNLKTAKSKSEESVKKATKTTKKAKEGTSKTATSKTTKAGKTTTKTEKAKNTKSTKATKTTTRTLKKEKTENSKTSKKEETEATKTVNSKVAEKKVEILEYYDLPYRYNQTIVKILAQNPNTLFVYWDISDADRIRFEETYNKDFFNYTYPVLYVINKTKNYSYEVPINDFANSWYLHVTDANCEYQIELGRKNKENTDYYYITSSNNLDIPNNHILFENLGESVLFENIKNHEYTHKSLYSIPYLKNLPKSNKIYELYKTLFNNEIVDDEINFTLPSSNTSSNFK